MKKIQFVVLLLLCISQIGFAKAKDVKKNVNIVFIGNSITYGAGIKDPGHDAPPVKAGEFLQAIPGMGKVRIANCGVSGMTTVDYLPATATRFPMVQQAADGFYKDKSALLVFSFSLGTNDSAIKGPNGSPVSPKQYQTNVKVIIDRLLTLYPGCRVVIHRPLWYSPNTYNGAMYLQEGLTRLQSYLPEIEKIIADYAVSNPRQVWMGDRDGFDYFKVNHLTDQIAEEGNAGTFYLHPNEKGAAKLGELWAKAILPVLK